MEPDSERMDVSPFLKLKGLVKKTFAFRGCKLWNDLPAKSIARNQSFKVAVNVSEFAVNHIFLIRVTDIKVYI